MLSLFCWSFLFFQRRATMYWRWFVLLESVWLFSSYLMYYLMSLSFFSLVSFYYFSPQRDTCILITPLGTCQKKLRREGCEKWCVGYLLISLSQKSTLSKWPEFQLCKISAMHSWSSAMQSPLLHKSEAHKCTCICACMFAYKQFRLLDAADTLLG